MGIKATAQQFFDACETGKGWAGCQQYCHPNAAFSAQAGALANLNTLEAYTEWMKGLFTPLPDGNYEVRSFAVDDDRQSVAAYGIFRVPIPARAVLYRRPGRRSKPTTSTSWSSTATRSAA